MPFESVSFAERAQMSELMDEPCSYEELRDCLRSLESVNRVVLSYRPTINWLKQSWLDQFATASSAPLHIVDVGFGAGDMLRRVEQWAAHKRLNVRLTGIDLNPHSARAAQEFTPAGSRIRWLTADLFTWQPDAPVDIVINSLLAHHLTDADIPRFLAWMEDVARRGWFINDLSRGPKAYRVFQLLARLMRWHPYVLHDGPVSILRSFTVRDWQIYVHQASLAHLPIAITPVWPGRLCVSRVKVSGIK